MKDIKDFTLREIEEIQNQAAIDFKLLLRDFFRDHPYIKTIQISRGELIYVGSAYIHNDDHKNEIKSLVN